MQSLTCPCDCVYVHFSRVLPVYLCGHMSLFAYLFSLFHVLCELSYIQYSCSFTFFHCFLSCANYHKFLLANLFSLFLVLCEFSYICCLARVGVIACTLLTVIEYSPACSLGGRLSAPTSVPFYPACNFLLIVMPCVCLAALQSFRVCVMTDVLFLLLCVCVSVCVCVRVCVFASVRPCLSIMPFACFGGFHAIGRWLEPNRISKK